MFSTIEKINASFHSHAESNERIFLPKFVQIFINAIYQHSIIYTHSTRTCILLILHLFGQLKFVKKRRYSVYFFFLLFSIDFYFLSIFSLFQLFLSTSVLFLYAFLPFSFPLSVFFCPCSEHLKPNDEQWKRAVDFRKILQQSQFERNSKTPKHAFANIKSLNLM